MKKNIIFITKDAFRKGALPVYGEGCGFKTPNIDELAAKGTVFHRHYTAGGSTAMAFISMALGKYCYETDRKLYNGKEGGNEGDTLFDELYEAGYDVHIAWDDSYRVFAEQHFKCEGKHTTVHALKHIIPFHPAHVTGKFDDLTFRPEKTEESLAIVEDLVKSLSENREKPIFLWLHMPHVFAGRNAYDSDIDVFDQVVGIFRKYFDDDTIHISADHGQMAGHKGKFGYGFDTEDSVMNIPLITPKFMGLDRVDFVTSTVQMAEIFGVREFKQREYVFSETAYYCQPCRKVAVVHGNFKLVYDKKEKKYFLYDLAWDKDELHNLYYPEFYDVDRHDWYSLNQRFYYPNWEEAHKEREYLTEILCGMWRNGSFFEETYQKLRHKARLIVARLTRKKKQKHVQNRGK